MEAQGGQGLGTSRRLLFKAVRLVYHSTLGWRVINKKEEDFHEIWQPLPSGEGTTYMVLKTFVLKMAQAKALTGLCVPSSLDSGGEGSYLRLVDFCVTQL